MNNFANDNKMLKEKTAVITGSNRGIGLAVLELFAENGANIIACCRTVNSELKEHFHKIEERFSVNISIQLLDLSDEQSISNTAKEIVQKKKCDILINCAGIAHSGLFQMTSIKEIRNVFEVNYFGHILLTQPISRLMARQKSGVIVNVASVLGIDSEEGGIAYGASKAALIHATKTMAAELVRYNIRVNAVAPGMTDTDMLRQNTEEWINKSVSRSLMQRAGEPKEIAQVILFLASDMSSFITGQTIHVDGGR